MKIGELNRRLNGTEDELNFHKDGCNCNECNANVVCEQEHCRGQGKDQQFYCAAHGVELCSICRFAHEECQRQGLLLRGSRDDNEGIRIPLENKN